MTEAKRSELSAPTGSVPYAGPELPAAGLTRLGQERLADLMDYLPSMVSTLHQLAEFAEDPDAKCYPPDKITLHSSQARWLVGALSFIESLPIHLVEPTPDLQATIIADMRLQYPKGSRVAFWRSANQKLESFGTVIGHSTAHGAELRVRYDNSTHVVGLHVGYTKFHSLPTAAGEPGA